MGLDGRRAPDPGAAQRKPLDGNGQHTRSRSLEREHPGHSCGPLVQMGRLCQLHDALGRHVQSAGQRVRRPVRNQPGGRVKCIPNAGGQSEVLRIGEDQGKVRCRQRRRTAGWDRRLFCLKIRRARLLRGVLGDSYHRLAAEQQVSYEGIAQSGLGGVARLMSRSRDRVACMALPVRSSLKTYLS